MKQMTCEMCGGTDIQKEDGVFVCKSCGCKYAAAEATTAEPSVITARRSNVNNSSRLFTYNKLAKEAVNANNYDDAIYYYEQMHQLDANSWEGCFFSVYYAQIKSTMTNIYGLLRSDMTRKNLKRTLMSTFDLIEKNVPTTQKHAIYSDVASHCFLLVEKMKEEALWEDEYGLYCSSEGENCAMILYDCGCVLESYGEKELALEFYRKVNSQEFNAYFGQKIMDIVTEKIKALDPTYTPPLKKAHCYVATAVYGSYDCSEVWTLRRFRDYCLSTTWCGRAFIHTYYAISPTIIKWFGHTDWFKKMWRRKLDHMVKNLQDRGYKSDPYEDRNW